MRLELLMSHTKAGLTIEGKKEDLTVVAFG
jgi:hypothetical protein